MDLLCVVFDWYKLTRRHKLFWDVPGRGERVASEGEVSTLCIM